mmetsp:Transcript_60013/g.113064  ORF Transcript_60013/g.113064 Transcript_60013/m.113064 type:complete len:87 (-) Transcript_60013:73-333(-)
MRTEATGQDGLACPRSPCPRFLRLKYGKWLLGSTLKEAARQRSQSLLCLCYGELPTMMMLHLVDLEASKFEAAAHGMLQLVQHRQE